MCFIVAMFVFFPTNKSKFIENISAKMLTAPAAGYYSYIFDSLWNCWITNKIQSKPLFTYTKLAILGIHPDLFFIYFFILFPENTIQKY